MSQLHEVTEQETKENTATLIPAQVLLDANGPKHHLNQTTDYTVCVAHNSATRGYVWLIGYNIEYIDKSKKNLYKNPHLFNVYHVDKEELCKGHLRVTSQALFGMAFNDIVRVSKSSINYTYDITQKTYNCPLFYNDLNFYKNLLKIETHYVKQFYSKCIEQKRKIFVLKEELSNALNERNVCNVTYLFCCYVLIYIFTNFYIVFFIIFFLFTNQSIMFSLDLFTL